MEIGKNKKSFLILSRIVSTTAAAATPCIPISHIPNFIKKTTD